MWGLLCHLNYHFSSYVFKLNRRALNWFGLKNAVTALVDTCYVFRSVGCAPIHKRSRLQLLVLFKQLFKTWFITLNYVWHLRNPRQKHRVIYQPLILLPDLIQAVLAWRLNISLLCHWASNLEVFNLADPSNSLLPNSCRAFVPLRNAWWARCQLAVNTALLANLIDYERFTRLSGGFSLLVCLL